MSTEVKFTGGESIEVSDDYREVYEKLLAAACREPCVFRHHHCEAESLITIQPAYIAYIRPA